MRVIYKYKLGIASSQLLELPFESQILSVQYQGETLVLWALVETASPRANWEIRMNFTGEAYYGSGEYISTVQKDNLVIHVFVGERIRN